MDSAGPAASTAARRFVVRGSLMALATAATMPFDVRIAEEMRDGPLQKSAALRSTAKAFDAAGDPGVLLTSAALYIAGRAAAAPRLTSIGLHAGEAAVIAGATTSLLKAVAGRQRPYVVSGDADDFTPFHVATGHTSLPSRHTTVAFSRVHPHNRVERVLGRLTVVSDGNGITLAVRQEIE